MRHLYLAPGTSVSGKLFGEGLMGQKGESPNARKLNASIGCS